MCKGRMWIDHLAGRIEFVTKVDICALFFVPPTKYCDHLPILLRQLLQMLVVYYSRIITIGTTDFL